MSDPRLPEPELPPQNPTPHDPTTVQPTTPPPPPPVDPTTVQPVTSASAATPAVNQVPPVSNADIGAESYELPPERTGPGPAAGVAVALVLLLVIGAIIFFVTRGDDDGDDVVISDAGGVVTLTVVRTEADAAPLLTSIIADVTGPPGDPAAYVWQTPDAPSAPATATATTNNVGEAIFQWLPIGSAVDWQSTAVLSETLLPNATLSALSFPCSLDRQAASGASQTLSITLVADVQPLPANEARATSYTFPNHQFLAGDRVRCEISAGAPNVEPTTTIAPDTTLAPETTVAPTTTAVPVTTVTPTTVADTVPPAPAPETTAAPDTTAAPATTQAPTTTQAPASTAAPTTAPAATNALTTIDARDDLSTFGELIDTADLREQLDRDDVRFTVLAPDNDAIAAFVGAEDAPDLTDQATAQDFVLSYVLVGDIVESTDLAERAELQFEAGPVRQVDASASPITVGGAPLTSVDEVTDLAVVHTLGATYPTN